MGRTQVCHVSGQGHGVAITLVFCWVLAHWVGIAAVGKMPDGLPLLSQRPAELIYRRMGQLPNGANPHAAQLSFRSWSNQKQISHWERPQLPGNLLGKETVDPVGLLKVPGNLCQELVGRHTDVDRKAQLPVNPLPEHLGSLHRRTV